VGFITKNRKNRKLLLLATSQPWPSLKTEAQSMQTNQCNYLFFMLFNFSFKLIATINKLY